MFRWLQFWRPRQPDPSNDVMEPLVTPDQVDLPTPRLREMFAGYVNSGKAVFGVDTGEPSPIAPVPTEEFQIGGAPGAATTEPGPDTSRPS